MTAPDHGRKTRHTNFQIESLKLIVNKERDVLSHVDARKAFAGYNARDMLTL